MLRGKKSIIIISVCILSLVFINSGYSADESVLFTSVPPDALIVLDLSGSMNWNPAGTNYIWGSSVNCTADTTNCSGTNCLNGYCNVSKAGCNVNCSRLAIAKRAIFNVLDDNNDNQIKSTGTNQDDVNLNVRIGYMRFYGGNDTAGNYALGNNRLVNPIGTNYAKIFCDANTCSPPGNNPSATSDGQPISTTRASGGTPLSSSMIEARSYLAVHKAGDNAKECRDYFVILITDGADTYACGGTGTEDAADMYKRRRETVARVKALGDAGYKVFVIGFGGDMPTCLQRTLNWAAYYGNTDNPTINNSGDTGAYAIPRCPCTPDPQGGPDICPPCSTAPLFPSGITTCSDTTTALDAPGQPHYNLCGKGGGVGDTYATSGDPATSPLEGYAFVTANSEELSNALRQIMNIIRSARYSFTLTSISTARITAENHLYEASFTPIEDEPFWQGRLKKYNIDSNGNIGSQVWDAGELLKLKDPNSRNIVTYKNGAVVGFNTSNIAPQDVGLPSTDIDGRNLIVGYIRGEPNFNDDNWKLGDIWHSSPVVITSPSPYFKDYRDVNNAFANFRNANQRTSANGRRVVMAGANDGQLHVFNTSSGSEVYSFIPPNMLPKLKLIAHNTHPTNLTHQFFVDGPISAADVWLGSGSGTSKSASEWKTLVVFGLGRGVVGPELGAGGRQYYLWSASPDCTPTSSTEPYGYSKKYTASTPHYCGYYAFDFTDTLNPVYKWRISPSAANAPYLGDPWSKMSMGRVMISGNEKWVGFIGGGVVNYTCSGNNLPEDPDPTSDPDKDKKGRGFYVVDLTNGNVLWSYTKANNANMELPIPAPPAAIDSDNDGFIDRVYVGDLGGNIWRFNLCMANNKNAHGDNCTSTSGWRGSIFYDHPTNQIRPVYTSVSVAKDTVGNIWVYWGTGDKQCPADPNAQEHFYALKDNDGFTTYEISDIQNLGANQTYDGVKNGWRILMTGQGEKILAEPTVFGGTVYFTTYTPAGGNNPCIQGGTARLYGLNYVTGKGALTGGERSMDLGTGIPTAPIISLGPEGASMYVTVSGGSGIDSKTISPDANLQYGDNRSNILFWRDRRVQ